MAVSNPATMSSVYAEFGAPAGTPLSAFLRGGAYVPNVAQNANVPTALPIRLSQLAGAVKYTNVSASASPTSVSNTFNIKVNPPPGTIGITTVSASGGTGSYTYTWSRQSGSTLITASPSGNRCTFSMGAAGVGTYSAVWQCVVSDGTSSATVTVNTSASVTATT